MCAEYKVRKNFDGDNIITTPVSNYEVKICRGGRLIKLTEPSDTLNIKRFLKHCILQTILHVFLLFISA